MLVFLLLLRNFQENNKGIQFEWSIEHFIICLNFFLTHNSHVTHAHTHVHICGIWYAFHLCTKTVCDFWSIQRCLDWHMYLPMVNLNSVFRRLLFNSDQYIVFVPECFIIKLSYRTKNEFYRRHQSINQPACQPLPSSPFPPLPLSLTPSINQTASSVNHSINKSISEAAHSPPHSLTNPHWSN